MCEFEAGSETGFATFGRRLFCHGVDACTKITMSLHKRQQPSPKGARLFFAPLHKLASYSCASFILVSQRRLEVAWKVAESAPGDNEGASLRQCGVWG